MSDADKDELIAAIRVNWPDDDAAYVWAVCHFIKTFKQPTQEFSMKERTQ